MTPEREKEIRDRTPKWRENYFEKVSEDFECLLAEIDRLRAENADHAAMRESQYKYNSLLAKAGIQTENDNDRLREDLGVAIQALQDISEDKFVDAYWDRAREALSKIRGEK